MFKNNQKNQSIINCLSNNSIFQKSLKICLILVFTTSFLAACGSLNVDKSVLRIIIVDKTRNNAVSSGSGFVITSQGHIATAQHVITQATTSNNFRILAFTEGNSSSPHEATVVWQSSQYDIAVLKVSSLNASPLTLNTSQLSKEEDVKAIGFPGAADAVDTKRDAITIATRTRGEVSRVFSADWKGLGKRVQVVQHTAPINSGSSGGPLINNCNQVIGINTLGVRQSEGTFFSSHASELAKILNQLNISAPTTSISCNIYSYAWNSFIVVLLIGVIATLTSFILLRYQKKQFYPVFESLSNFYVKKDKKPTPDTEIDLSEIIAAQDDNNSEYLLSPKNNSQGTVIPIYLGQAQSDQGVIIGRTPSKGGILVKDRKVSREHIRISCSQNTPYNFFIEDLASKNGTTVNSKKLYSYQGNTPLNIGDEIRFGSYSYKFMQRNNSTTEQNDTNKRGFAAKWRLSGNDPTSGQHYSFNIDENLLRTTNGILTIGRDEKFCDIVIPHKSISGNGHAQLILAGSHLKILDMKSTNGTIVNGKELDHSESSGIILQDNMVIELGSVTLHVEYKNRV